jgi:hypothetical protein
VPSLLVDQTLLRKDPEQFDALVQASRVQLLHLSLYYPEFSKWFAAKVLPGLSSGERSIVLRYVQGRLGGISILKSSPTEKKLCCLRVLPHLAGTGLGVRMFDEAFTILGTTKPLLSVADEQLPQFDRVFRHFGFELTERYRGIYRPGEVEHSFNGRLIREAYQVSNAKGDEDEIRISGDSRSIHSQK